MTGASSVNSDRPGQRHARRAGRLRSLSGGFTYLGVLVAVALMGISLAVGSEIWVKVAERQKRAQLDWVMDQYVKAIESYYYANTGSVNYYPARVEDLLLDPRHLGIVRHLRRAYVNPFTNEMDWRYVAAPSGGIAGVEVMVMGVSVGRVFRPVVSSMQ